MILVKHSNGKFMDVPIGNYKAFSLFYYSSFVIPGASYLHYVQSKGAQVFAFIILNAYVYIYIFSFVC